MLKNILTIDLEDWRQSTYDQSAPISENVLYNTENLLNVLNKHNTRATFFCLGLIAEKYPDLIRMVHADGHEIATHGWSHRSVKALGANEFRDELGRSIRLLEDICGEKVLGHRAPDFSIDLESGWAFDAMKELGLLYDSSVFPIRGRRYGSPECEQGPFQFANGLWEIPLSTIKLMGRRLPVLGGGYFRLYPYRMSAFFVKQINLDKRPAVVYLHPYELNADELADGNIDRKTRIHQGLFRSQVKDRLKRLLTDFQFVTVRSYLKNE
jgi:polysaccharide deacetylase family protein (PEP-CTERM system associated)